MYLFVSFLTTILINYQKQPAGLTAIEQVGLFAEEENPIDYDYVIYSN